MRSTMHTSDGAIITHDWNLTALLQLSTSRTAWPEALVSSSLWQGAAAAVTVKCLSCQPPNSSCMTSRRCATAAKPGRADGMGCQHS